MHRSRFFAAMPAIALAALVCTGAAKAQQPVAIRVGALRDGGGLPRKADEEPLNLQLSQGLVRFMQHDLSPGVSVSLASSKEARRPIDFDAAVYDLEGEVSRTAGSVPGAGTYLVVLRLFRDTGGADKPLVAQWAASARTFLDLSCNMTRDRRVSAEGLIGELGTRVLAFATGTPISSQALDFVGFAARCAARDRITADIVPEASSQASPDPTLLRSGDRYRIRVSSGEQGVVYLVGIDSDGNPRTISVEMPGNEAEVAPGRPVLVPIEPPIPTGEILAPTRKRIVVLVRRKSAAAREPVRSLLRSVALTTLSAADVGTDATGPAVEMLDCGPAPRPFGAPDAGVARILDMAATDPDGTWLAKEIVVRILPAIR